MKSVLSLHLFSMSWVYQYGANLVPSMCNTYVPKGLPPYYFFSKNHEIRFLEVQPVPNY